MLGGLVLLGRSGQLSLTLVAPWLLALTCFGWAWWRRQPPLLIAAGALLGLATGLTGERLATAGPAVDRGLLFLGLASGWALIPPAAAALFRQRVRWPFVPAVGLALLALWGLANARWAGVGRLVVQVWPLALLLIGCALLLRPGRRR